MESGDDSSEDPRQRIRERAAQIREHLAGIERAVDEPGGGDAIWHHLDQLGTLLLRFDGDARFFAMKLKGYAAQDGRLTREG